MNRWIPRNPFLSVMATASLAAFGMVASISRASDQSVGVVSFANSGSPAAQADFLTGLAQLHNFEYSQAAEAFRRARVLDPTFAMAYWGEAMTSNHAVWHEQDLPAARATLTKLGATPEARAAKAGTPREKAYLRAVEILYGEGDKNDRPPSLDKPANELPGEVLLELGRAKEARAAFEAAQTLAPGRGQSLIGLSRCASVLKDAELAANVDARLAKVGLREALAGKGK